MVDAPTTAPAPFNFAKPLFQYERSLLRRSAGNAAKLLRYQSALLRLWAAAAPRPWFQYQSSLVGLWADGCQLAARNLESVFASPSTGIQQQELGTPLPRFGEAQAQAHSERRGGQQGSLTLEQDNKPITDQPNDVAAEVAVKKSGATPTAVEADEPQTAATNQKPVKIVSKAATARKKTARKTLKAPAKRARRAKNAAASTKVSKKTLTFSNRSRRRK
jgi:hypothetical protein